MTDDLNGFSRFVRITGRSFEQCQQRMITDVRVPATLFQYGESASGMSWAILKLSALEKPGSKVNKPKELSIPPSTKAEQVDLDNGSDPAS